MATLQFEPFIFEWVTTDSEEKELVVDTYVLYQDPPEVGGVFGVIEVEGELDPSWVGKEKCVFYKNGNIIFEENAYHEMNRAMAYPDIKDQLDMLYWDKVNGTTIWQDKIAEVKAKYPKPIW